jgi:hypothetical protein
MKLVIEVSGIPSTTLEEHKHSIVAAVEDQVEHILAQLWPEAAAQGTIEYDQYVSWDVE